MSYDSRLPVTMTENATEFVNERLGFIRILAENTQRSLEIGDRFGADHSMRSLAIHTKAAIDVWNDLNRRIRELEKSEAPDHAASTE